MAPLFSKERARFQANFEAESSGLFERKANAEECDFAVTTKERQWQCLLKSKPSSELVIVLLDMPTISAENSRNRSKKRRHTTHYTQRIRYARTEIPYRIFILLTPPPLGGYFCSKLKAPNRGTSLGPFVCVG
jgi:hypothetical protein